MSAQSGRRGFAFLLALLGIGAFVAVRHNSLRRAADLLGTHIPRGAMAIRRESLVDLTVDGRPVRQTVFIAESADEADAAGEAKAVQGESEFENVDSDDVPDETPEPDPGELNSSGTLTETEPENVSIPFDPEELHAEAEAVLAEADRTEDSTIEDGIAGDDLAVERALEESMNAPDAIGTPDDDAGLEAAIIESIEDALGQEITEHQGVPDEAAVEPVEDEIADQHLAEEDDEGNEDEPTTAIQRVDAWEGSCPDSHPIKVRFATGRFHEPGSAAYDQVVADACYASVEAAIADGFSASPL